MGLLPEAALSVPLITLLNSNKRRIENMDQIHAHLQDKFPSASYNRLESSNLEQLSIRDRVWHSVKQYDLQCDAVLCCTVLVEAAYRQSSWSSTLDDTL